MNLTATKKILLVLFLVPTILLFLLRHTTVIQDIGFGLIVNNIGFIHNILLFFPLVLTFSILTYYLPKKYFVSWWKFARFAIPLVFIVITIINLQLHHTPGGWMNMDHAFDRLFTWIIFILFTLGSLIQIVRGYWSKGA